MSRLHVKKNDTVVVLVNSPIERNSAGKLVRKRGRVIEVNPQTGKVLVEGFRMMKKHMRQDQRRNIAGGILEREGYINVSNVMVVCPACTKPTRVKWDTSGDKKNRLCKHCGGNIDQ